MRWEEADRWLRVLVWLFRVHVTEFDGVAVGGRGRRVKFREAWSGVANLPAQPSAQ